MPNEEATSVTCRGCGAAIAPARLVAELTCSYCNETQPNPTPFDEGQEVVFENDAGWSHGRVAACHGPNEIEVSTSHGQSTRRFDELIAVKAPRPPLAGGEGVFFKSTMGWQRSWVVAADEHEATMESPDPGFESDFFDEKVPLSNVRVPSLESQRSRRAPPQRARTLKKVGFGAAVVVGYVVYLWLFG